MANLRHLIPIALLAGCGGTGPGGDRGPTAQWTITAAPATYSTPDSVVRLSVPADAVPTATTVRVERVSTVVQPPAGVTPVRGAVWSFTHVTFETPATLTFSYRSLLVGSNATPGLYRRSEGSTDWIPVPATVDNEEKTLTSPVRSFTSYGLFIPTPD